MKDCRMSKGIGRARDRLIEKWNTRTEPKEQDVCPVDKIREVFDFNCGDEEQYLFFKSGYETGAESKQAEIERLRNKIPIVSVDGSEICFDGKGYTEDEEIERLIAENEAMRCCGNCGNYDLAKYGTGCKCELICIYGSEGDVDNWQPKENN